MYQAWWWWWCVCRLQCTKKIKWGENEYGLCVCVLELYVIDEIEKGVFNILELFIDDSVMLLEKYNVEIF
jgi:hypothetical protein